MVDDSIDATPLIDEHPTAGQGSLLVLLNHRLGPGSRCIGILASGTPGPSLPKKVPALIELDLDLAEPLHSASRQRLAGVSFFQLSLFVCELDDSLQDIAVIHSTHPSEAVGSALITGRGCRMPL
jgi:hypothetical protein